MRSKDVPASLPFEASTRYQVLRRCPNCERPHPRARKPPLLQDDCPECGIDCLAEQPVTVKAQTSFAMRFWLWIVNGLNSIAAGLLRLSERF